MTPGAMMRALGGEARNVRRLTGEGEPGMHTLLGGAGAADGRGGVQGAGSTFSRVARPYADTRLASAVAGASPGRPRIDPADRYDARYGRYGSRTEP